MGRSMKKKLVFGAVALAMIGGASAVDGSQTSTTTVTGGQTSTSPSTTTSTTSPSMARGSGAAADTNQTNPNAKREMAANTEPHHHHHHKHHGHRKTAADAQKATVGTTAGSANMHNMQPGASNGAVQENVSANINMPANSSSNNAVTGGAGKALLAVNDVNPYSSNDYSDNINVFQGFDDQAALGVSLTAGSLFGTNYTNYGANIDVSKLYDNGVWFNVNANQAINNSMSTGSANALSGSLGYAFQVGNMLEIIPNVEAQRTQLDASTLQSGVTSVAEQATITDALADVRLELATSRYFNIFADGGYGLASYDITAGNAASSTSGGILQAGAGVNYRPLLSEPWILNAQYFYQDFNQVNIGAINGVLISTGITF